MGTAKHQTGWLVVLGAIVLSFVAATAFAQWRTRAIDAVAVDISDNAMPSILSLTAARSEMRHLWVLVREGLARKERGAAVDVREIEASRLKLDKEVNDYLVLPVFPHEQQLWGDILTSKDALDHAVIRFEADVAHPDPDAARADFEASTAASEVLAAAISRSIEFDASRAHDLAIDVQRLRARSVAVAFGLDAACVLVTIVGVLLLRRTMKANAELEERHRRLESERASEMELFAGRVAHDILSPLGTVSFAMQLAARSGSAEDRDRQVRRGEVALARVKRLVNGLLAFAHAAAQPEKEARSDVGVTLADLVTELDPAARQAGAELVVESAGGASVACHPGVLTSLIANLAYNAIKYIGDGPVRRITIRALDRADVVRVEVVDTGPGLPPSLGSRVFEPYVRGEGATQPGIGLGLATVKRMAEAHGGRVGVRSVPGEGCTFWFELPKAAGPVAEAPAQRELARGA